MFLNSDADQQMHKQKLEGKTSSNAGREHVRVETSPVSDQDFEMDYSPATRKPPIHN